MTGNLTLDICIMLSMCLVGMSYALADKALTLTKALPNGAAATATDGIDLEQGTRGRLLADMEFLLEAPAMNTTQMPNAKTMTYSIEMDDNSGFSSATVINAGLLVQTGAGGAGCAAASQRFRLPSNCERYVRVKATGSGAGDASGVSMTLTPVF